MTKSKFNKDDFIYIALGVLATLLLILGATIALLIHRPLGVFVLVISGLIYYTQHKFNGDYTPFISQKTKENIRTVANELADKYKQNKIESAATRDRQEKYVKSLQENCNHELIASTVMGGSGWDIINGEILLLSCRSNSIHLNDIVNEKEIAISFSDLVNLEVSGPGTQHSNFGLIGGGFGAEGALKGIVAATVINLLTTRAKTSTFLRICTSQSEIMLSISTLEPVELRLLMSPAFIQTEATTSVRHHSLSDEIQKLHQQFKDGILSEDEFSLAKNKLINN